MVQFKRIKGLTQESIAQKMAEEATKLIQAGFEVISITQYSDSNSIGRNKAGTIYYK